MKEDMVDIALVRHEKSFPVDFILNYITSVLMVTENIV